MSARVNLYLVPSILVLAAAGASWLCARTGRVLDSRKVIMGCGCLLAAFGAYRLGNDLGRPYRAPWDRTAREFARWFWEEMPAEAEVVCVRSDLGIPFRSGAWAYDGADQYLCYQRIYSRRHREGARPSGVVSRRNGRYGACCCRGCRRKCRGLLNGLTSIETVMCSRKCEGTRPRGGRASSLRSFTWCAISCRRQRRSREAGHRN